MPSSSIPAALRVQVAGDTRSPFATSRPVITSSRNTAGCRAAGSSMRASVAQHIAAHPSRPIAAGSTRAPWTSSASAAARLAMAATGSTRATRLTITPAKLHAANAYPADVPRFDHPAKFTTTAPACQSQATGGRRQRESRASLQRNLGWCFIYVGALISTRCVHGCLSQ